MPTVITEGDKSSNRERGGGLQTEENHEKVDRRRDGKTMWRSGQG